MGAGARVTGTEDSVDRENGGQIRRRVPTKDSVLRVNVRAQCVV